MDGRCARRCVLRTLNAHAERLITLIHVVWIGRHAHFELGLTRWDGVAAVIVRVHDRAIRQSHRHRTDIIGFCAAKGCRQFHAHARLRHSTEAHGELRCRAFIHTHRFGDAHAWSVIVWILAATIATVLDGRCACDLARLNRCLTAEREGFIAFKDIVVGGLNRDAERGVTRWDCHFERTITIDGHGLCGAILISDSHFGTREVRARHRAVARQRQGHRGRYRARIAQTNVKRGAFPF